jgi:hypothetical protein
MMLDAVADARHRRHRRTLAAGLEHAVAAATRPWRLSARIPVARGAVIACAPELLLLAERLRSDDDVADAGLELVEHLLTDSLSPLFAPATRAALRRAVAEAAAALGS